MVKDKNTGAPANAADHTQWITQAELARRMGITAARIRHLVTEGRLTVVTHGKKKLYDYLACKREIELGRALVKDTQDKFEGIAEARLVYETYKAELARLEFEERTGKLIEAEAVADLCRGIITVSKTKLLSIPRAVAPGLTGCKSTSKISDTIEAAIYQALDELSKLKNVANKRAK